MEAHRFKKESFQEKSGGYSEVQRNYDTNVLKYLMYEKSRSLKKNKKPREPKEYKPMEWGALLRLKKFAPRGIFNSEWEFINEVVAQQQNQEEAARGLKGGGARDHNVQAYLEQLKKGDLSKRKRINYR